MSDNIGPGLYVAAKDVPHADVPMKVYGGSLETQQAFGVKSSLMYATRTADYHSVPHYHDCEQLNYCVSGRMWIFIEDHAQEMHPGDYLRVPPNAVHWAWNRGDEDAVLLEVHTPGLDLLDRDHVAHLVATDDEIEQIERVPNVFLPDYDCSDVELRYVGETTS